MANPKDTPTKEETPAAKAPAPPAPTVARIVLFAFKEGEKLVERPAIVVGVGDSTIDLQVFTNGDDALRHGGDTPNVVHRASVAAGDDMSAAQADRWRWPPRAASSPT